MRETPILYLDIDGTVRKRFDELGKFVNKASDVVVFPEVPALLSKYKEAGWRIVGISNHGLKEFNNAERLNTNKGEKR